MNNIVFSSSSGIHYTYEEIISAVIFYIIVIIGIIIIVKKRKKRKEREEANNLHKKREIQPFGEDSNSIHSISCERSDSIQELSLEITQKEMPYQKKYLLTKNEWYFYKALKPICDKYNLHILSKIRMADLVQVKHTSNMGKWYSAFGKINAKHVDFALAQPDNLKILLLIELDDKSHKDEDRKERDKFVDEVYLSVGYKILRTYDTFDLEKKILELIDKEKLGEKKIDNENIDS